MGKGSLWSKFWLECVWDEKAKLITNHWAFYNPLT
jgi:hypothetical protein